MSITKQQIEQVLEENRKGKGSNRFYIGECLEDIKSDLTFKEVEQVGGEDQGSTYYLIFEVTNSNKETAHIKFDGYYSSYNGAEFDSLDFTMVEPYMRQVRDWKRI